AHDRWRALPGIHGPSRRRRHPSRRPGDPGRFAPTRLVAHVKPQARRGDGAFTATAYSPDTAIGISNAVINPLRLIAIAANAPAVSLICSARAVPIACAVRPSAKPRTVSSTSPHAQRRTGPESIV